MSVKEETLRPLEEIVSHPSRRVWTRKMIVGGVGVLLLVLAIIATVYLVSEDQPVQPVVASVNSDAILRDLVNQGLIPSQALQPAAPSTDAILRDLVNQGLIPSQALND